MEEAPGPLPMMASACPGARVGGAAGEQERWVGGAAWDGGQGGIAMAPVDMWLAGHVTSTAATDCTCPAGPSPPGWVCYAEKTHGAKVIPYMSTTRSPQVSPHAGVGHCAGWGGRVRGSVR